jgi:hypothetical protein
MAYGVNADTASDPTAAALNQRRYQTQAAASAAWAQTPQGQKQAADQQAQWAKMADQLGISQADRSHLSLDQINAIQGRIGQQNYAASQGGWVEDLAKALALGGTALGGAGALGLLGGGAGTGVAGVTDASLGYDTGGLMASNVATGVADTAVGAGSSVPSAIAGFTPDFAGAGGSLDLGLGASAPGFSTAGGSSLLSRLGQRVGGRLASSVFGGSGSPAGSGGSPSPLASGAGSSFAGNGMAGIDWNSLLGNAGGLYQQFSGAQGQQQQSRNQQDAFNAAHGAYGLGPYGFNGPGGITATGGPNGGVNLGSLNPAFSGYANTAGSGAGMANQFLNGGLPANIQQALSGYSGLVNSPGAGTQGGLGSIYGGLMGARGAAGSLMGAGFNQLNSPLIGQANGAASGFLNNAGTDFNSTFNNSYSNLLAQLKDPMQQAQSQLMDQEFQRGQMGSSAGGLQTQNFAKGLGQAMLGAQGQAFQQALGSFNSDLSGAGTASGIANNGLSLGNSLLSNAFGQFNNTSALGSNVLNSIYNQNADISNTLYGRNSQNVGMQTTAAGIPANIASQYLGVANGATTGANTLNSIGLGNYNMGLNSAVDNNRSMLGSGQVMGGIANNSNYMPGNAGWGNLAGSLFGNNGNGPGGNNGVLGDIWNSLGFGGGGGDTGGGDILSNAGSTLSDVFSDRRLKHDVQRVGSTHGGTPLYSYKYIWGGPTHIGVMADEAPPDAVRRHFSGFAMVDYSRIQ